MLIELRLRSLRYSCVVVEVYLRWLLQIVTKSCAHEICVGVLITVVVVELWR